MVAGELFLAGFSNSSTTDGFAERVLYSPADSATDGVVVGTTGFEDIAVLWVPN